METIEFKSVRDTEDASEVAEGSNVNTDLLGKAPEDREIDKKRISACLVQVEFPDSCSVVI